MGAVAAVARRVRDHISKHVDTFTTEEIESDGIAAVTALFADAKAA